MTWWAWVLTLTALAVGSAAVIVGHLALRTAKRLSEYSRREVTRATGLLELNEGLLSELHGHPQGAEDSIGRRI